MTTATTSADPGPDVTGPADLIDALLGIAPGDRLDAIRRARPAQREHTQRAYQALVRPVDATHVSVTERLVVAWYVAELHRHVGLAAHYRALLENHGADGGASSGASLTGAVLELVRVSAGSGPYGRYREPGLAGESTDGPRLRIGAALGDGVAELFGPRLTAALEHAHLLTFRPRESSAQALQALLEAGWSATGVVTLSQLVAFGSYQVRVVDSMAVLAGYDEQRVGVRGGSAAARGAAAGIGDGAAAGSAQGASAEAGTGSAPAAARSASAEAPSGDQVVTYPDLDRPEAFTQEPLG
ncbi:CMD domain protein [Ruania zhangjianzhongii]|uniref:CMD domain protein n=1 Tax=Ruania zhangjianzhongii TaxID=2603206 RepID=UPI001F2F3974|nr:CMD domain protein [Ruania zhangjianzhongii]